MEQTGRLPAGGRIRWENRDVKMTQNRYLGCLIAAGLVLFFVLYLAVPMMIWRATGTPSGRVAGRLITGPFAFLFWLWVCCLWWCWLDRRAGRMNMGRGVLGVLMFLPVILIGGRAIYCARPSVRAASILASAELARCRNRPQRPRSTRGRRRSRENGGSDFAPIRRTSSVSSKRLQFSRGQSAGSIQERE